MLTQKTLPRVSWAAKIGRLVGWLSLAILLVFCFLIALASYSVYDEEGGPFYLSAQTADLDLDGDLDVLVHNMRNPREFLAWAGGTLWINQGGLQGWRIGQFGQRLNDLQGGWSSTLADLDQDGDLDVLVYDGGRLSVGLNRGGIQGGQPGEFRLLDTIRRPEMQVGEYGVLVVGDIDGDGRNDALVLGRGQAYDSTPDRSYRPNVSWAWLNNLEVHGVFDHQTRLIPVLDGLSVADAALADLDQDGDLDLLIVASPTEQKSMNGSAAYLLWNDGRGEFDDSGQRFPAKDSTSLALGDLDGDGDLDALLGYRGGAQVLINQGGAQAGWAGTFAAALQELESKQTRAVRLADLDNDGDLDGLLVGARRASLWWNDGQASFSRGEQSIPCGEDQNLTTGDFNGDGFPDIFVAQYNDKAQLWRNDGQGSFEPD